MSMWCQIPRDPSIIQVLHSRLKEHYGKRGRKKLKETEDQESAVKLQILDISGKLHH